MITHETQKRRNSEVLWLGLLLGQRCRSAVEKKVTENSQWRCQTSQKETDGALRLYCSNFHKSFTNTLLVHVQELFRPFGALLGSMLIREYSLSASSLYS